MTRKTAAVGETSKRHPNSRPYVGQQQAMYANTGQYDNRHVMDPASVSGVNPSAAYYAHQDMSRGQSSQAESMSWSTQAQFDFAAYEHNQYSRSAPAQMPAPQPYTENSSPTDHSHMTYPFPQNSTSNHVFNPQSLGETQPSEAAQYAGGHMNMQAYAQSPIQSGYGSNYWPSNPPFPSHANENRSLTGTDDASWLEISQPGLPSSSYAQVSPRSSADETRSFRDPSPNTENQNLPQNLNPDLLGVADVDRFPAYSNFSNSTSVSPFENPIRSPGLPHQDLALIGPLPTLCGTGAGAPQVQRKKRKLDQAGRENAKQMRRIHPCLRCKTMRIKCDGGNPCENCHRVATSFRSWYEACSREDLGSVCIVRRGNGKFGQATAEIVRYLFINPNKAPRTIELRWSIPDYTKKLLPIWKVDVHEFKPREGDITKEEWEIDGHRTVVELPCFASYDDSKLRKSLQAWVGTVRPIVQQEMLDDSADKLTSLTLREAQRYADAHGSNIILLALRIWSTAKLTQGWASIVGEDTLDTPQIDRAADGFCGSRPISPALCHQIDVMFLEMLYRDEQLLLRELKKKLFPKKQQPQASWYEIFLAYFVMVTHLEFVHGAAVSFMECRQNTTSSTKVSPIVRDMVGKWDYSAKNLLCHFRNVLRGMLPFELAKKNIQEVKERASLDAKGVEFLKSALRCLQDKDQELKSTKDQDMQLRTGSMMADGRWVRCLFRDASYRADSN